MRRLLYSVFVLLLVSVIVFTLVHFLPGDPILVRLGIEATVFGAYEFRLLPDFSNDQAPGVRASSRIQDAYMNVHYWDSFQVQAGRFKRLPVAAHRTRFPFK